MYERALASRASEGEARSSGGLGPRGARSLRSRRWTRWANRALSQERAGTVSIDLDALDGPAKEQFYSEDFAVTQRVRVDNELSIRVETNGVRFKVTVTTEIQSNNLLLHWGVSESKQRWDEWKCPPESIRPKLTQETVGVCQTRFTSVPAERFGKDKLVTVIEGDIKDSMYAINFVLYDKKLDQWLHNSKGGFWHVQVPQPPEPQTVSRSITTLEDYEEPYEEEEEYDAEIEEEIDEPVTPVKSIDLQAQTEASMSTVPEETQVLSSTPEYTDDASNAWRRLLRPPVEPMSFQGNNTGMQELMNSLYAKAIGEVPASRSQDTLVNEEAEKVEKEMPEETEPEATRKLKRVKTMKMKRMVTKTVTKRREVTRIQEEKIPVKLVEGSWITTSDVSNNVQNEREVQLKVGALVEKDAAGGGVRMRVEAEVPWPAVLHWGIVPRGARDDVWSLPPEEWRPEGTIVYKEKACETLMSKVEYPLATTKSISFVELELGNAPTAVRFVLKEVGGTRWVDLNGADFVIPMPEAFYEPSKPTLQRSVSMEEIVVAEAAAARAAELQLESLVDMVVEPPPLQTLPDVAVPEKQVEIEEEEEIVIAPRPQTLQKSAVGNGREILLQGFNWESCKLGAWYQNVERLAPTIAKLGFSVIWLPPPTDSVSQEGYMPRDYYVLDSRYGTKQELQACIQALHDNGVLVLGDAVLNHRCAHFQDERGIWNRFGGKLAWDARAIVSDDPNFHGQGHHSDGDFFHAAPNIDHSQPFVKADLEDWMSWLMREVGYDGWRLDYVRGFWGGHVKDYMEATNPQFAVGEYWDALAYKMDYPEYNQDAHRQRIVNWLNATGGNASAFDVTTKGILHAVFERQEYWRLSDPAGKPPGVMGWWPSRAVTFIENHDTGSTQGHWRFPRDKELQGYCYILTHPGTPTVFWDHMFDNNWGHLHKPLEDMIRIRKQSGIHCRSEVKIVKCEQTMYAAVIDNILLMKIGPGQFNADGNWDLLLSGQDFAIWRKKGVGPR